MRRPNYFYGGFNGLLQSSEEGISTQNTLGGGIGRYLRNTNRTIITTLVGAAWQRTAYIPTVNPIPTQDSATGVVRMGVKLLKFNKSNLDITALALPFFSTPGRVNFTTNASYYFKLSGNLNWTVTFYGSWDNQLPRNLPAATTAQQ